MIPGIEGEAMNLLQVPGSWRGFSKSVVTALALCTSFVVGDVFNQLQGPDPHGVRKALLFEDFGQLGKYRTANLALRQDSRRVVFFGDSITYLWDLATAFPGQPYLNRGIGGQTTSQMLVRFRRDVLDLEPYSVVIMAGTNDLGETSATPTSIPNIEENFQTLAELAAAHHIRPVFASVLPVNNYTSGISISGERTPQNILTLNEWLRSYCARQGYTFVDYHSALVASDGMMRKDFSEDGLHPNAIGYKVMASVTRSALAIPNPPE
jgi:lysophospholipase L1-like esterase